MRDQENMDRLHDESERLAEQFLERSKDKKGFVCPKCGHGSGTTKKKDKNTGDGITFTPAGRWHCFGCGAKGDIIDLYQLKHGVDFKTAKAELCGMLGLLPDEPRARKQEKDKKTPEQVKAEFEALTFSPIGKEWRGLSPDLLTRYGVKGCEAFKNPLIAGTYYGPRKVIAFPTAGGCYFVRALSPKEGERTDKWDIGGKMPFNLEALESGKPVFVVEGAIDALSIIQAGGEAIGLSGTDGIKGLVEALKKTPSPSGLLIAPDNDEAGKDALPRWVRELEAVGAECIPVDVAALFGEGKDANGALNLDPKGFGQRVAAIYASLSQVFNPWGAGCDALVENIEAGAYAPIPTGLESMDKMLGGGFSPGQLVVLTAPPAKGKTSFCQGLMETMAIHNPDFSCLYFCFEMSREQLQARSIARLLHERGQDVSSLDVMQGKLGWREGVSLYQKETGGRVAYLGVGSGLSSSGLEELEYVIKDGLKYNASIGRPAPFIVIDYLQLVDVEGKEEQEAIKAVMERMKAIALGHKTVVIAIAANNRETNKKGDVSMYGGRGSSSIEYGADIVLALAGTDELEQEPARKDERLSLVMPKGRFYDRNARADFEFRGKYSEFVPVDAWGQPAPRKEQKACDDLFNGV